MKIAKRAIKEANIIIAAERIFAQVGFKNAKMEDIAAQAGITKVTLYSYFQSKENMYLAVTFKALQLLTDLYLDIRQKYREESGFKSCQALIKGFVDFCEENYLYSEVMLDYFALIRSSNKGQDLAKLPVGIKDSIYFEKIQTIQNEPFKITVKEIERGQADGSINKDVDPMLCTLFAWSSSIGYIKLLSASQDNSSPLLNVNLPDLKKLALRVSKELLQAKN